MLEKSPSKRVSAEDALKHEYFEGVDPVSEKEIDFGNASLSEEDQSPMI
jgi:hypothetical protein